MAVTAIILAGGQASRMGGEKPLRILRGRTLLQHAVDLVADVAAETIIATGKRELPMPKGVTGVPDAQDHAGKGPLAGVLAGLAAARHPQAMVLACDLPNLPPALLKMLLAALGQDCDCAWAEHAGHPEPLIAALNVKPALAAVRRALAADAYKVLPCWESMAHRVLGEAELAGFAPLDKVFANLNTLEELERQSRP